MLGTVVWDGGWVWAGGWEPLRGPGDRDCGEGRLQLVRTVAWDSLQIGIGPGSRKDQGLEIGVW